MGLNEWLNVVFLVVAALVGVLVLVVAVGVFLSVRRAKVAREQFEKEALRHLEEARGENADRKTGREARSQLIAEVRKGLEQLVEARGDVSVSQFEQLLDLVEKGSPVGAITCRCAACLDTGILQGDSMWGTVCDCVRGDRYRDAAETRHFVDEDARWSYVPRVEDLQQAFYCDETSEYYVLQRLLPARSDVTRVNY